MKTHQKILDQKQAWNIETYFTCKLNNSQFSNYPILCPNIFWKTIKFIVLQSNFSDEYNNIKPMKWYKKGYFASVQNYLNQIRFLKLINTLIIMKNSVEYFKFENCCLILVELTMIKEKMYLWLKSYCDIFPIRYWSKLLCTIGDKPLTLT